MAKSQYEAILALQLAQAGLTGFEREYVFHPTRKWRLDFADPITKVALAVQGGIWSRGRHVRPLGYIKDCEKYAEATMLGWRVYHLPAPWIADSRGRPRRKAIELVKRAVGAIE